MAEEQKQQDVGQVETDRRQQGINDGIATMIYALDEVIDMIATESRQGKSAVNIIAVQNLLEKVANEFTTVNVSFGEIDDVASEVEKQNVKTIIQQKFRAL